MKAKYLLVAALAAVAGLASCSKDDSTDNSLGQGEKVKLTIKIAAPTITRAAGLSSGDGDNKINNFVAFVFKANGSLEEKLESADSTSVTSTIVTTAAREVYVVSNVAATEFVGITTKTALLGVLGDLAASANVASQTSVGTGNVWASGTKALTAESFVQNASNEYEANVTVELIFVPAKINVTVNNQMTNQLAPDALTITKVAVLNAPAESKFFGTPLTSLSKFYAGIDETGFRVVPADYSVQAFLQDDFVPGTGNHFYVFENNSGTYPVIVTLVASFGNETRYFPVHFSLADAGYQVVRGNIYNVNITLTGSATDDSGTDDPTDPVVSANMTVSVSVKSWIVNPTINKEF